MNLNININKTEINIKREKHITKLLKKYIIK